MKKKQFAVIGMGRFGSSVAKTLYNLGYDVLAIDHDESRTDEVVEMVTHAVTADSTDEDALRSLGLRNFDVVVVAIGQDIQASILTTLILKEMGVGMIVVKAQNELHGKVLAKIGADKVIYPERDMGARVAHHLISPNILDHIELSNDYSIVDLEAGPGLVGKNLRRAGHPQQIPVQRDGHPQQGRRHEHRAPCGRPDQGRRRARHCRKERRPAPV